MEAAVETPFMAQRRKLRDLKEKQDSGVSGAVMHTRVHPKAQARRDAEAAAKPVASKKVSKKKKAKTTGD